MGIQRTREEDDMDGSLQSERCECEKESVVVVANAGRTVVVVLGNAIDVDVNKHDDDGTNRAQKMCVTSMMKILLFVCFFFAYFLTPEFLLSFTKNIHVSRLLRVEEIPSPFARGHRRPGAAVDRSARGARESTV